MNRSVLLVIAALAAFGSTSSFAQKKDKKVNPAMAEVEDVAGLPRVLLIGDSISIGYTVPVRKLLEGKANVHRPLVNCGPSTKGLADLDQWLNTGGAGKKWDVIHFNWGLHDLKYMGPKGRNLADPEESSSQQQVPPAEYEKNLRILAGKLQATGAKVVWRNTTPVPPGAKGRVVGDSVKYNEIAEKVMKELKIPTNDLFTISKQRMAEMMRPANVHFTPEGNDILAAEVVAAILPLLSE
ncbi:MAG: SGNH/GDSL hydrolase family protein [Verrucomicrobiales bacterium]|nr:SGNH/GDSL hydrolase family protein [Verrucomicrobiales bacterium]